MTGALLHGWAATAAAFVLIIVLVGLRVLFEGWRWPRG
jgi:hypothetical protein